MFARGPQQQTEQLYCIAPILHVRLSLRGIYG